MNSLYTLGTRQTNSLTADLERLRNGDNSASLLGQISASLAAMQRTIEDYDAMIKREIIKAKQEKGQMRVQKFRADYADLKSQFERINSERAASQRDELLQGVPSGIQSPSTSDARRRFAPASHVNPTISSQHSESPFQTPASLATLREHHALHEHSFLQTTEARLDEFLAQGREVLDNLVDQRNVLKGTQRRLLDAANTLGLSRDVIGWIERRSTQDMYIFLGGAVFTFLCFFFIWRYLGYFPTTTMSAGPSHSVYDYTEGASAIDINDAVAQRSQARRDSQYGAPDDAGGAMFDGPGHIAIPSGVSRMSYTERDLTARRSSEWSRNRRRSQDSAVTGSFSSRSRGKRRMSTESQISRASVASGSESRSEDENEALVGSMGKQPRHPLSPTMNRSSVFENIAQLFGRGTGEPSARRTSISGSVSPSRRSRRSRHSDAGSDYALGSEDEGEERWGYSSGEEDDSPITSDVDFGSDPPSPTGRPSHLPLFSSDPIFGDEVRIDIDAPLESLDPPPPGPPSRQTIYVADEDSTLRFVGYEVIPWRRWVWWILSVLTFGMLTLLGHWLPRLWLRWVVREKAFKDLQHGFVVIESPHRDITLFPVKRITYPYERSTVFLDTTPESNGRARKSSVSSRQKQNGDNGHCRAEMLEDLHIVDYRYSRFALDIQTGLFTMVRDWRDPIWTGLQAVQHGLPEHTRKQRLTLFGPNLLDIAGKSTFALLVDELQALSYGHSTITIIMRSVSPLISTLSVVTTLMDTKKTIKRMREMSRFNCEVVVYTDERWKMVDSSELVPGDIVNLSELRAPLLPADMFILSGDAIVNESMLTGESVPVSKNSAKDENISRWRDSKDIQGDLAKSFLYGGTRVVRIRGALALNGGVGGPALGLVIRTGFNTTKGALVRSMLFPKPMGFKFYRDSMHFITVLAGIAGLGFCVSAIQFVRLGVEWDTIVFRALDLITIVVPPALPATLSIGTSFAIGRLRKLGIFCIAPTRVNVAGKINVCCFDKTGTLTEDGLDILGVRSLDRLEYRFGELINDVHDLPATRDKATFLHALATCHSLKMVEGNVIGDPLDVKMFDFTKWTLEEGLIAGTGIIKERGGAERPAALVQTVVRPPGSAQFRLEDALKTNGRHAHFLELGVIRTFEFVSSLRRMSVVVRRLKSSSMEIYVKGAPEVMVDICEKDSFPHDYDDLLSYYTRRGYRVIAIAGKSIEGLSWLRAQKMKREQAESSLRFLGLIIFENRLKPGTTPAIQTLRTAHLACRMITGDNPLTAVSVARESTLINPAAHVFSPVFIQGNATTPLSKVEWSCMDDPSWKLDDYSLRPLAPPNHTVAEDEVAYQDYTLVATGDVFRWMINYAPLETLQRMLVKTQVFARMSPDEKNEVVERLQALGYTVLMCGDGANDCAALKAADVGISLSEAEASVAAPFTSNIPDIGCVIEVIKEGRAALATSFSCFKYMALYSLIQFTTITLLYSFASSLGDLEQFLYIDLFIIIPIAVSMGRTHPFPKIYPKRPTASLVSKKVLVSLIGQVIITSGVQLFTFIWVRRQEWYTPPGKDHPNHEHQHLDAINYENTVLFLVSCFQYVLVAAVFSIGPPYRKSIWTNAGWLMVSIITLSLFNLVVLLCPPKSMELILELMPIPFSARAWLTAFVLVNVVVSLAFEEWATELIAKLIGALMVLRREKKRYQDGKAYKVVEGGMRCDSCRSCSPTHLILLLQTIKSWLFVHFDIAMYTLVVAAFCLFLSLASALPAPDVIARQAPSASVTVPAVLASPTSITTTNTFQNANGTYTESCVYTFTPVNGQIQEVKNCTLAAGESQVTTGTVSVRPPLTLFMSTHATSLQASSTATATASASPMVAAIFVMPGTTIQVLPFGLGIYGGITAIAIAAVVYVTFERVRYRKNFRQQRMAETNLMGYGVGTTKY
ncbi:hypothetical protein JVU11DRAFT_2765 [Chiua virens]|nr:hypothetical protein JVU11DRAFT_2765 [Chiua virens]